MSRSKRSSGENKAGLPETQSTGVCTRGRYQGPQLFPVLEAETGFTFPAQVESRSTVLCYPPGISSCQQRRALASHPSATAGEEQNPLLPARLCQALGWAGTIPDGPCLEFPGGGRVSLLGWPGGVLRKVHPRFFGRFRLLTCYAFRACVSVGMSKISPWILGVQRLYWPGWSSTHKGVWKA